MAVNARTSRRSAHGPSPYRPSWVDEMHAWLEAGPLPVGLAYVIAWLFVWGLISGTEFLAGTELSPGIVLFHLATSANSVLYIAAVHSLDRVAERALAAHRPALRVDDATVDRLAYELTTMPARPVMIVSLVMIVLQVALLPVSLPAMRQVFLASSPLATVVDGGIVGALMAVSFGVLIYHTVRQLRIVNRIYTESTAVSLFGVASLYSLARVNVRTGLTLVLLSLVALSPGIIIQSTPALREMVAFSGGITPLSAGLAYMIAASVSAVGVIVVSLVGVHRMLEAEKGRVQQAADRRLADLVARIHRSVDHGDFTDADALNRLLDSVIQERDVIARTPTWPWSPGTQNALISAIIIPIVLWLLQRLLETLLSR